MAFENRDIFWTQGVWIWMVYDNSNYVYISHFSIAIAMFLLLVKCYHDLKILQWLS